MTQPTTRPAVRHFPLYIAGERVDTDEHAYALSVRTVLEPSTPETAALFHLLREGSQEELHAHPHVLCSAALSTPEHGQAALRAAADAVPRLRAVTVDERLAFVRDLMRKFQEHRTELSRLLRLEGCPRLLAEAQLNALLDLVRPESLEHARVLLRQEITTDRHTIVLQRQPDGVVCVNPPPNAPLFGVVALSALLAGNAIVIRVPRSCAASLSYALHNVIIPAMEARGIPAGTINVLCADYEVTMRQWLASPLTASVFYFGSSQEGLELERSCVEHGKKAILELSGNDGVMVWHDADLEHAAAALTEAFYASGQVCFSPKYVIAHPAIADDLLDRLSTAAAALRPGDPERTDTALSPVLHSTAFHRRLDEALAGGATKVCGGRRVDVDGEPSAHGLFIEPTIVRVDGFEEADTNTAVREESYFPLLAVVVPEDEPGLLARSIRFINDNAYGMRNSLWAEDPAVIEQFTTQVSNGGMLKVNDSHMSVTPCLAGLGGTGRSGGTYGELSYPFLRASRMQAVTIAHTRVHPREAMLGTH
ncbi:aldehyde dehydrogenase family protein [Streptomyces sp. NPDC004126]|uniref:aldehyde dehydrogenase family protein n=1 Tax=Streptomyces sp. NPDC004126 TaxID=3390695 RepID=UPI003D01D09F